MPDLTPARPASGAPIETSWGQAVHDMLEGIQYGTESVGPFNATTTKAITVVFPRPFAAPPVAILTGMASVACGAGATAITATQFTLSAKRIDGVGTDTTQLVGWIAIGTPA